MSPTVVSASWLPAAVATAEGGEGGFNTPGVANFWWPVIPFDGTGPWAVTRPALVLLLSVGLLAWFYVGATRMVAAIATLRGYDVTDPQVRTTVLLTLVGSEADEVLAKAGLTGGGTGKVVGLVGQSLPPAALLMLNKAIGFRLLGNPSGEPERFVVRVREGVATVETVGPDGDAEDDRRDATVTCEAHDYLRLATGHLNPLTGVLKGQLKVKGDRAKALKLASVIDIPEPL